MLNKEVKSSIKDASFPKIFVVLFILNSESIASSTWLSSLFIVFFSMFSILISLIPLITSVIDSVNFSFFLFLSSIKLVTLYTW